MKSICQRYKDIIISQVIFKEEEGIALEYTLPLGTNGPDQTPLGWLMLSATLSARTLRTHRGIYNRLIVFWRQKIPISWVNSKDVTSTSTSTKINLKLLCIKQLAIFPPNCSVSLLILHKTYYLICLVGELYFLNGGCPSLTYFTQNIEKKIAKVCLLIYSMLYFAQFPICIILG